MSVGQLDVIVTIWWSSNPLEEFYQGTFLNDLRHGKGKLFNTNGEVKIDSAWELGRGPVPASKRLA